jgi:uncharacterized protein YggT (Ycf19 family)
MRVILWVIEAFLIMRFALRLFAANPAAPFARFVYSSTDVLLQPFRGLFPPKFLEPGHFLEFSTLFAMAVYAMVIFLFLELIDWMSRVPTVEVRMPPHPHHHNRPREHFPHV